MFVGLNTDFIEALPTAFMKPLSGSGARGMMVDAMQTHGADSFIGRLTSTFQGSTDTTFYIIALYFGSVSVRKTRHAVAGRVPASAGVGLWAEARSMACLTRQAVWFEVRGS